ncbi:MAG: alkaline phosphatase family protein [Desulfovibrionaceae bacterium]
MTGAGSLNRPRLVVLGLDGLPCSLARRLASGHGGELPHLARLALGARAIRAEVPELSPVNWTSFFTGQGPEAHGVYGFTRLDAARLRLELADATWVRCPTIFDRLGAAGLTSKVVNLPNTYPARPLRGMLVAGFVAPEMTRAVFPPVLAALLPGYKLEADTTRGAADPDYLLGQLAATLDSRRRALDLLWPDLAWDLFVFVLTETDRLFHFLYPACEDSGHPRHADCLAFLRRWDGMIGEVLARYDALPGPKRLLVLADHGFTTLRTEVDLNAWLRAAGRLVTRGEPEDEWDAGVLAPAATAFALDPGRIYVHDRARFPRGCVAPADIPGLAAELRAGLLALTFEGEPVMQEVLTADQAYPETSGPRAPGAPDLLCVPRPGFDLKAKWDRAEVFSRHGRFGTHTRDDAFFCDSAGAAPARVRDVGRLVLEYFNLSN